MRRQGGLSVYRPTVRYDDRYKEYVQNVFHSTHLDRNQIIRLALFAAAHSDQFANLIEPYLKRGMSLPKCSWKLDEEDLWLNAHSSKESTAPVRQVVTQPKVSQARTAQIKAPTTAPPPKILPSNTAGISLRVGGRHYTP